MAKAEFRFYEELNDFLPPERRKRSFRADVAEHATVKQAVEALGVPHTEVELILANGLTVDFSHRVGEGDRISVYPRFETLDVTPVLRLHRRPLREPRFIADAHMGGLARYLRMLGFDTLFRNDYADAELVAIAAGEHRIILTRDRGVLMHRAVSHGCYIRATRPRAQLQEIVERLDLYRSARPFTRCMECNALLARAERAQLGHRLPAHAARFSRFWRCTGCGRLYWEGSHVRRMRQLVGAVLARGAHASPPG